MKEKVNQLLLSSQKISSECDDFLISKDEETSKKVEEFIKTQQEEIDKAKVEVNVLYNRLVATSKKAFQEADDIVSEKILASYASFSIDGD
ncbi:MAG: hypothetical protein SPL02_00735 [Bacilli bacterium]|nr:hypothetical protein [Bacilli bacterium]MDY6430348.1 hypothetical protein [Bacilli bacterium]